MDLTTAITVTVLMFLINFDQTNEMGVCKFDDKFPSNQGSGSYINETVFRDCYDVYLAGHKEDGVYTILPFNWLGPPFSVSCNMTTIGGGWTVFRRREYGSMNFLQNWNTYKDGFGSLSGELWLGNEKLHYLTNQRSYKLRIDIVTDNDEPMYSEYSSFAIDDEVNKYRIVDVGTFSGDGGDGMAETINQPFSTYDQDEVCRAQGYDCARSHQGAWWYTSKWCGNNYAEMCSVFPHAGNKGCTHGNLNGKYNGGNGENIFWDVVGSERYCNLKFVEMKLRPSKP